jgi:hypothetical protein
MALTMTIVSVDSGTDNIYVLGMLSASGNYSTGGDTLDFTTVAPLLAASQPPLQLWAGGSTGDSYAWIYGNALNNQKVKISTASTTELASGAYPSRISGDANIQFEAVFAKMS